MVNLQDLNTKFEKAAQDFRSNDRDIEALSERANTSNEEASDALNDPLAFVQELDKRVEATSQESHDGRS